MAWRPRGGESPHIAGQRVEVTSSVPVLTNPQLVARRHGGTAAHCACDQSADTEPLRGPIGSITLGPDLASTMAEGAVAVMEERLIPQ